MKISILTGAGMSAESGLKTFRDSNGLWEGHDVMQVASPQGFARNPELVLEFYNQRRRQLLQVNPNKAHIALAELEVDYEVTIITQNVDDLHERAGSKQVVHLHGELLKVRSTFDENLILDWHDDLNLGDLCEFNHQLRPHIVWFGEAVPKMDVAIDYVQDSDIILIVGTSMQVYPAAGLIQYTRSDAHVYFVDPKPAMHSSDRITVLAESATSGVPKVIEMIRKMHS
ncbi:MAG: NAD-dependent deacylase [Bacteroidia bacterium]|nr:NAD-dependent deacylase [Bacteroidia bacterium]MBT8274804.1 NAD-dependent deacylase [Bacteroidia bacterium]NNF31203.1 NAD-dependent deacylase [Flavobacteriaceae bacterium]NNK54633.1 NAD-dependent deacylase [Flavobacteriaceae bacterium]NNM09511.1 NAD-dependent deacylase [Flavobacteriaceae bacterium]